MIGMKRMCRSEFLPTQILYGARQNNCPLGRSKLEHLLCEIDSIIKNCILYENTKVRFITAICKYKTGYFF